MTILKKAIQAAFHANGSQKEANKAYLEFIKANFIIPVEKHSENEPKVLFLQEQNQCFLPVFSDKQYLDQWSQGIEDDIALLKLSGVDLLKGIGESVVVCLDIGSQHYKEFNAGELARMRSMVIKFFN